MQMFMSLAFLNNHSPGQIAASHTWAASLLASDYFFSEVLNVKFRQLYVLCSTNNLHTRQKNARTKLFINNGVRKCRLALRFLQQDDFLQDTRRTSIRILHNQLCLDGPRVFFYKIALLFSVFPFSVNLRISLIPMENSFETLLEVTWITDQLGYCHLSNANSFSP